MYRQILVHPEDCELQRILWQNNTVNEVREYRLKTVTYGLACAPFLANSSPARRRQGLSILTWSYRTLLRFLCGRRHNRSKHLVGGHLTVENYAACAWRAGFLSESGLPIMTTSWLEFRRSIDSLVCHTLARTHEGHFILGLHWHPINDHFSCTIQAQSISEFTKRRVLAETARLFDPLGWLTPVVMRAKIFIQSAWLRKLDWDTPFLGHSGSRHLFLEALPRRTSAAKYAENQSLAGKRRLESSH